MDTRPDVPMLKQRLLNNFNGFGDDMLRMSGIGEFATSWPLFGQPPPTNYDDRAAAHREAGLGVPAAQPVAGRGQADDRHVRSRQQDDADCDAALVDRARAAHRRADDQPLQGDRRRHRGASVRRISPAAPGAGPPLRTIVDSGIHVGAGSDSAQISTLNPWLMIYYMVTGKNSSGVLINAGQQITRDGGAAALHGGERLVPARGRQARHDRAGKLGDVVVLSDDYFDPTEVPDEAIKRLKSVLTVVDGKVVHNEMR